MVLLGVGGASWVMCLLWERVPLVGGLRAGGWITSAPGWLVFFLGLLVPGFVSWQGVGRECSCLPSWLTAGSPEELVSPKSVYFYFPGCLSG